MVSFACFNRSDEYPSYWGFLIGERRAADQKRSVAAWAASLERLEKEERFGDWEDATLGDHSGGWVYFSFCQTGIFEVPGIFDP